MTWMKKPALSSSPALLLLPLLLVFCTTHDSFAAQQDGGSSGGAKRALLIGINKYRAVPKLQGSLNDIETMRQVLITRWGFPEANIRLLVDEQATRAGLLTALKQFVDETGPLDTVYIHYSGHGSQVIDFNGDEPDDRLDETLVPQDGRTESVPDITDDELDLIFARLPTKNALIVLDSCHSGTATRSLAIRTRSIPQDTRLNLYQQTTEPGSRTRGHIQPIHSSYVLMTGAAAHQEALDGPIEGRFHGFFSYALSKSLSSSSPFASPRDIFRSVEAEFRRIQTRFGRVSMPEPQLEAPLDLLDKPLLGSIAATSSGPNPKNESRLAWLDVKTADSGTVTLLNGKLLGATPGSSWAIYAPSDTTFTPGKALAIATVRRVVDRDALATYQPSSRRLQDHSRAVALLPAPSAEHVPVQLIDLPSAKRKQVEDVLRKHLPNVVFVEPEQVPRYVVRSNGGMIQLLAADGLQLVGSFREEGADWGGQLAQVVSRSASAHELLTLDNPSSQLKLTVHVAEAAKPAQAKIGARGIAVMAANTRPAKYRVRKPGDPRTVENSLQLEISVNADAYLTIVDVDAEGGVNLLFPNDYAKATFHPNGSVRSGELVLIPDSLKRGNQAGFYWDYSPPIGMDTIRVFGSRDVATAQLIRYRVKALQATSTKSFGKPDTRSVIADISSLREDLAQSATRGIVTLPNPSSRRSDEVAATPSEPSADAKSSGPFPATPDSGQSPEAILADSTASIPDWAAASVTILVSE